MSEWQTIDSSPKDGTTIDLWVVWDGGHKSRVPDAHWGNGEVRKGDMFVGGWNWQYFSEYDGEEVSLTDGEATHWMPRPGAPQ